MRVALNPLASRGDYTPEEAAVVSRTLAEAARQEICRWEGYEVTPLRSLTSLSRELGLGELIYKDEKYVLLHKSLRQSFYSLFFFRRQV